MSETPSAATESVSDAERALLRKSVRDLLARRWPAGHRRGECRQRDSGDGAVARDGRPGTRDAWRRCLRSRAARNPAGVRGARTRLLPGAAARRRRSQSCARQPRLRRRRARCWTISIEAKPQSPLRLAHSMAMRPQAASNGAATSSRARFRSSREPRPRHIFWCSPARGVAIVAKDAAACGRRPRPALRCRRSHN